MTVHVEYAAHAGKPITGVFAEPEGQASAGAVLVLHEWWGINNQITDVCKRFAKEGFLALAPDLYHGKRPESSQHAASLSISLDRERALAELDAAARFMRAHPRCNGKVGVTGFCLGGAFAFGCACELDAIAAVVPFYGVPRFAREKYAQVRAPIQAHFAQNDDWAKVSSAQQIQAAVTAGGGSMTLFVYEAGHAFMRVGDKNTYHEPSATLAWNRTIEFLKAHLGS